MWDVGDPILGTGGKYGFGYDPIGGYAFGVTNQDARPNSFYSPLLFDVPGREPPVAGENQFAPDYEAEHASNVAFVTGLYREILNRDPDTSGRDFWVSRIEQGLNDRASVEFAFRDSIEYRQLHPASGSPPSGPGSGAGQGTPPAAQSPQTNLRALIVPAAVLAVVVFALSK